MKSNPSNESLFRFMDVYLDGVQLEDCLAADEEKGIALVKCSRNGRKGTPAILAEPGDLILEEMVVKKIEGKIKIKITPTDEWSIDQIKRKIEDSWFEMDVYKVIEYGPGELGQQRICFAFGI